jgi:cell wall-associated NlpC family hydrolase
MNAAAPYQANNNTLLAIFSFLVMTMILSCETGTQQEQHASMIDSSASKDADAIKDTNSRKSIADEPVVDNVRADNNELYLIDTSINTGKIHPDELIRFAETLTGIPYIWASSDPKVGFDCSGFITYVFTHFNIRVPRSSIDFMNIGRTIPVADAKRGDLILFTGTNPMEKNIGHMGLVVSNHPVEGLQFIHATSGKAMSVTVTTLNDGYKKRFVRISRIFPQNG